MPEDLQPKIIEDVVDAAKRREPIAMDSNDLAEILDKKDAVKARAEQVLKSRDEWKALKDILETEKADPENKGVLEDEGSRQGLLAIETQIDAQLAQPETVTIDSPDDAEPKTLVEKAKRFISNLPSETIGMVVSGWITLQRALISAGLSDGSPQQIDALENLYVRFFGAGELIGKGNALLEGTGIAIVKDKRDKAAYVELRKEFNRELGTKIKADPTNEALTRESYKLDAYFAEKVNAYAAANAGKKGRTTLAGILKNQRPAETSDAAA